jgi:tetratricopeptide (TPR) repeat protein
MDYERSLSAARLRLREQDHRLRTEREGLAGRLARLESVPAAERPARIRRDPELRAWSLGERLIEQCRELLHADTRQAAELAEQAIALAQELTVESGGGGLACDLQARAWGCLAEVLRGSADLRGADGALAVASSLLVQGSGDALEEAGLIEIEAALRRDQRRFEEAHRLLEDVIALYRPFRDFHLVGRAFMEKGVVHGAEGDFDAAIRWLRKGLGLIDPTRERRLELSARLSLMLHLHDSGRDQEAWFLLKASRPEIREHGGALLQLRLVWLEGKIQSSLGHLDEAEAALIEARQGFARQGSGFNAALVALDLARLYAGQSRAAEVQRLAEEMLPLFHTGDIHREAIAALIVFQQAARMEKLSSDLLDAIGSYLHRARTDQKLRFEYP